MDYARMNYTPFNEPVAEIKKIVYDEPPPPYDDYDNDTTCSNKSIATRSYRKRDILRIGLWAKFKSFLRTI